MVSEMNKKMMMIIIMMMKNDNDDEDDYISFYSYKICILQVRRRRICLHIHSALLAIKKNGGNSMSNTPEIMEQSDDINFEEAEPSDKKLWGQFLQNCSSDRSATLQLHMALEIPYIIPVDIINKADEIIYDKLSLATFEPLHSTFLRCNSAVSKSLYQQGSNSSLGNGYLLTNRHSLQKCDTKIKKCTNPSCRATNHLFPYQLGIFLLFHIY